MNPAPRPVTRRAAATAVAACLALAACGSLQTQSPTVRNADAAGGTIRLYQGDTLVVTLAAQPSTGYRWQTVGLSGPVLAQQGTADYLPAEVAPGTVGAPGDMVFRYLAQDKGQSSLDLAYSGPFEPGVAPAKTVHYDVTVAGRPWSWLEAWFAKP